MNRSYFQRLYFPVASLMMLLTIVLISLFIRPFYVSAEESIEKPTGTYSIGAGWSVDNAASTADSTVYKMDDCLDQENTSTITCSYLDTNYSVNEYEQLREMLANNLLYNNVDAEISAGALYTDAKDFLYVLWEDDASKDYRQIYYYVVGDYRCFCVQVKEMRQEAEVATADGMSTPAEVAQKVAEKFTWN